MNIKNFKTRGFVSISYKSDFKTAVYRVRKSWSDFCLLSNEAKEVFTYSNKSAGVGYEKKEGVGPASDIKENFDISISGLDYLLSLLNVSKLSIHEKTVAMSFISDAVSLVGIMTPYIVNFSSLCEKEFKIAGFKKEIQSGSEQFFIRFIYYPPQKSRGQSIAMPHLDQSGMTFHLFESDHGLECLTYDGKWIPMPVSEKETVVIPDMQMQLRSKGELRALWHRVVANKKTSLKGRYSAVSFVQFKDTPKYDKDNHGRLQEKPEGFNYSMIFSDFAMLFR